MKGKVYVAGTGVISAIGASVAETMESFRLEKSGIGFSKNLESIHKSMLPVGEVGFSDIQLAGKLNCENFTRTALLGIHAAREAVKSSNIDIHRYRTGLISATTVGGMDRTENFFNDFLRDQSSGNLSEVVNHACGRSTELIADDLGVKDYISTINTACSSSVNSIIFGTRLIQQGLLDVVVAGGTDSLSKFTLNGFNSLMILDSQPCRPFDATRNGLNLGEGAGFVVLVSEKVAEKNSVKPTAFVSGFGNTNDAYHQTASSPEGRGSFAAMTESLQLAGLSAGDIDYINLHGTGTVNNDQSEGTAIQRLFGERHPRLSSTKSFTGHTLGACGGVEAVFSILSIEQRCVYPNLRFAKPIDGLSIIPQTSYEEGLKINHVMSNSFGFGGNCSSIIFSRAN